MFPFRQMCSCTNFPKRLELLLYVVFALPNASMMGLRRRWGQRELGDVQTRRDLPPKRRDTRLQGQSEIERTYGDDVCNQSSRALAEMGLLFISALKEQCHSWGSQEATGLRRPQRLVPALISLGLCIQTRDWLHRKSPYSNSRNGKQVPVLEIPPVCYMLNVLGATHLTPWGLYQL